MTSKAKAIKIDREKSIKQSNRLIEARYSLTKYEQRMMVAICSQLNRNADDFEKVSVSVADMAKFCNFDNTKGYSHVKNTIMRLLTRTVQVRHSDGGWYGTHWLQSARYIPDKSIIEYRVDSELKSELLQIQSAYLDTQASPLMQFSRDYSVRLYFILKKMLKIKDFDYDLDFFRDRFQLGKGYNLFANLKNRILDPAIAEINEQSDIQVEYRYIKEGRKYTKIHFTVTLKKEPSKEEILEKEYGQQRLIEQASDDVQEIADKLIRRGVDVKRAKDFAKKYNKERIIKNLNYALKSKDTANNLPGLILHCIKEDIAGQNEQAKKELAERERAKQADKKQAKEFFEKMTDEQAENGKKHIAELMKRLKESK